MAWFSWDARCADAEGGVTLSADGLSASAGGWQPRVALADQPLARGLHYWRLRIDRYDGDADPAFGVARADVARDKMLGEYNLTLFMITIFIIGMVERKSPTSIVSILSQYYVQIRDIPIRKDEIIIKDYVILIKYILCHLGHYYEYDDTSFIKIDSVV